MGYIEELKELAKLKDNGVLTDKEFQEKKKEILSNSDRKPIETPENNKSEIGVKKTNYKARNKQTELIGDRVKIFLMIGGRYRNCSKIY